MADILAGKRILALDFTAAQQNTNSDVQTNPGTSPSAGSPEVGVTFVAPTSGKVQITVGGGIRDDGGSDVGIIEPQIFEDDSSGAVVLAVPNTQYRVQLRGNNSSSPQYASRTRVHTGLTAGQTYYARVMISGGTASVDFVRRSIDVAPCT